MKAQYQVNPKLIVEVEADTQANLFRQLAQLDEVFGEITCTVGGKSTDDVRFVVRKDKDENEYFEIRVADTAEPALRYYRKAFGCHKKPVGGLFPKRLESGAMWGRWNKEKGVVE